MSVQHRLFLYTVKELCDCCTRILKENEGDAGRVPQIWDWEANANCPHFTIYTGHQGQKSYRAASGQNCTKDYLRKGSAPDPAGAVA